MLKVRRAEEKEADRILKMHSEFFGISEVRLGRRKLLSFIRKGLVLVAEVEKEVAGYAVSHEVSQNSVKILCVAVREKYRRGGIGRTLVEHIVEWAKALGKGKIWLYVGAENKIGIKFWKSLGFEIEGYLKEHFRKGKDVLIMGRILSHDNA